MLKSKTEPNLPESKYVKPSWLLTDSELKVLLREHQLAQGIDIQYLNETQTNNKDTVLEKQKLNKQQQQQHQQQQLEDQVSNISQVNIQELFVAKYADVGLPPDHKFYNSFLRGLKYRTINRCLQFENWNLGLQSAAVIVKILQKNRNHHKEQEGDKEGKDNTTNNNNNTSHYHKRDSTDKIIPSSQQNESPLKDQGTNDDDGVTKEEEWYEQYGSLILKNNRLSEEGVLMVAQELEHCTNVPIIDFSSTRMTSAVTTSFLSSVLKNTALYSLNIAKSIIGQAACKIFAQKLPLSRTLTFLDISDSQVNIKGFEELIEGLKRCHSLIYLNISGNDQLGSQSGQFIENWIKNSRCQLQELIAANINLHSDGLKSLCKGIQMNPNSKLNKLVVSNNSIDSKGIIELFDKIRKNKSLVVLNMDSNQIHTPIGDRLRDFLAENKALEDLSVSNCGLASDFLFSLSKGLNVNKTLVKIDVSKNFLGDKGMQYLSQSGLKNVLSFRASQCGLQSGELLKKMILRSSQIYEIDVSSNQIKDPEGMHLLEAVEDSKTLCFLKSSYNMFDGLIREKIQACLRDRRLEFSRQKNMAHRSDLIALQKQLEKQLSKSDHFQLVKQMSLQEVTIKEELQQMEINVSKMEKTIREVESMLNPEEVYETHQNLIQKLKQIEESNSFLSWDINHTVDQLSRNNVTVNKQIALLQASVEEVKKKKEQRKKEIEAGLARAKQNWNDQANLLQAEMAKQENTRIASEIIIKRILMKSKKSARSRKSTGTEENIGDESEISEISLDNDGDDDEITQEYGYILTEEEVNQLQEKLESLQKMRLNESIPQVDTLPFFLDESKAQRYKEIIFKVQDHVFPFYKENSSEFFTSSLPVMEMKTLNLVFSTSNGY